MEIEIKSDNLIVTKTNKKGMITYASPFFLELVGYTEKELLGKPHNIIRHKDMPKVIFRFLWENIQNGREVNAFVKNATKNGDFYWVKANVTPSYKEGRLIGYFSVRRKAEKNSILFIEKFYRDLKRIEENQGSDVAMNHFNSFLEKRGESYESFISQY